MANRCRKRKRHPAEAWLEVLRIPEPAHFAPNADFDPGFWKAMEETRLQLAIALSDVEDAISRQDSDGALAARTQLDSIAHTWPMPVHLTELAAQIRYAAFLDTQSVPGLSPEDVTRDSEGVWSREDGVYTVYSSENFQSPGDHHTNSADINAVKKAAWPGIMDVQGIQTPLHSTNLWRLLLRAGAIAADEKHPISARQLAKAFVAHTSACISHFPWLAAETQLVNLGRLAEQMFVALEQGHAKEGRKTPARRRKGTDATKAKCELQRKERQKAFEEILQEHPEYTKEQAAEELHHRLGGKPGVERLKHIVRMPSKKKGMTTA